MNRILVSGSRSLDKHKEARWAFIQALENRVAIMRVQEDGLHEVTIVHGEAREGADHWTKLWIFDIWAAGTISRDALHVDPHPAKWRVNGKYNPRAGFERNAEMIATLSTDDVLIACWDGKSNGTKNAMDLTRKAGIEVVKTWL